MQLVIGPPSLTATAAGSRITATLQTPLGPSELFFEVTGSALVADATPFAALGLPLAMSRGWDLRCEAPISSRLLQAFPTIQDIYRFWLPRGERVHVQATGRAAPGDRATACGSFFSGGVDSYYTYLKNQRHVSRLIFVTGFDILLHQRAHAERVLREIRAMAQGLGVELIEVRTNLREISDPHIGWGIYHGAALAAVALLLAPTLGEVLIPSSHNYSDLFAWGSHPILDPLWSTESVHLRNDGCEARRIEKLALTVQNEVALRTLRVCYRNKTDHYNCGRCEKCLRTAVALYALGALDRCSTFEPQVNLRRVARLRVGSSPRILPFMKENLQWVQERRNNPSLVRALRHAMKRPGVLRHTYRFARSLCHRKKLVQLFSRMRTPLASAS